MAKKAHPEKSYAEYSALPLWEDITKASLEYHEQEPQAFKDVLKKKDEIFRELSKQMAELQEVITKTCPHEPAHHHASNDRIENDRGWHNQYCLKCTRCGRTLKIWDNR